MEMLSAADDSSGANPSSVKSDDSSPRHESGRGSPPPKCAICLGTCRNKSFTDSCLHQFCFKCLLTWSKVKAECPLCKQNFKSIIHNVRSNHQYDEYTVEQQDEETTQTIDIDNLTAQATRRFRYRTTLTLPRRDSIAIRQLLIHYPFVTEMLPPPAPRSTMTRRRPSPTTFRRTVYRHNLWARRLPDFTGRYRDCTPEFYRYNDSQMHRLVPWLNRELHYLLNENIGHISYVLTRILELLPRYHINSTEFKEALERYFGDRTEHFLHELYCFASTPYDMIGYDRKVQYTTDSRISTMVNEVISSSDSEASVDSDIVMVSSSHPAETTMPAPAPLPLPPALGAGPSRLPAPVYPQHYIPEPTDNVITIETISQSDTDDDDEVMVVGYIKPPQDRTPEVVDLLGSDSDVIVQDQPEPTGTETENRPIVPLVKLTLKRHRSRESNSESEDSEYRPPAPTTRRKRRLRSNGTATTSDTTRTTPSPAPDWASATESCTPASSNSVPSPSPATSGTDSLFAGSSPFTDFSTSSFSSYERRKRLTKRKTKRKTRADGAERDKKLKKRSSRSRRRDRSAPKTTVKENSRKSSSGKGVKSSKKRSEAATRPVLSQTPPLPVPDADKPGTSGSSATGASTSGASASNAPEPYKPRERRPTSHESRRLRSVVNVMFKNSGDSSPGVSTPPTVNQSNGEERATTENQTPDEPVIPFLDYVNMEPPWPRYNEDEDSDDLPLNLSVQKTYTNL